MKKVFVLLSFFAFTLLGVGFSAPETVTAPVPPSVNICSYLTQSQTWQAEVLALAKIKCRAYVIGISASTTDPQELKRLEYAQLIMSKRSTNDPDVQRIVDLCTSTDYMGDLNSEIQTLLTNLRDNFFDNTSLFDKLAKAD